MRNRSNHSLPAFYTYHNDKDNRDVYMIALRDENGNLIKKKKKHESRNPETMQFYHMK